MYGLLIVLNANITNVYTNRQMFEFFLHSPTFDGFRLFLDNKKHLQIILQMIAKLQDLRFLFFR